MVSVTTSFQSFFIHFYTMLFITIIISQSPSFSAELHHFQTMMNHDTKMFAKLRSQRNPYSSRNNRISETKQFMKPIQFAKPNKFVEPSSSRNRAVRGLGSWQNQNIRRTKRFPKPNSLQNQEFRKTK